MSTPPQQAAHTPIPLGTWEVTHASKLEFAAKSLWGMVTVKGSFSEFSGRLQVTPTGSSGELTIAAKSFDTRNRKRDEHLRSADFLDTDAHPQLSFTVAAITPGGSDQVEIVGDLILPAGPLRLRLPVTVAVSDTDRLYLLTTAAVTRAQLQMPWNRMGMIRDPVRLSAELELNRASGPGETVAQSPDITFSR